MALNTILYNGKAYGDQDIEDATGYQKSALVAYELPYDTFEAEVWDYANALLMLADSGPQIAMMNADGRFMLTRMSNEKMTDFTYGAPVTWTHRGKVVLKQFLESVKRTGKYKFLLSCVSGIGLIAKSRHYGGLYSNVPFSTVLSDVIGGAFPYSVDSDVASATVYGWLPVDNRRNNLRKLLTAYGVLIKANADGSIRFSSPDITMPTQLADQDLFIGGSVDHPTPYQAVKITEHAFAKTPNDILTTLLDGEAVGADIITPKGVSMNGALVTFNDPMHDLAITGSTILESGVNYAVLSPSTYCTLTGYKYSHTTRIVTAGALTATEQATKRLDDCTLVNLFNVDAVAQRWLEYYSAPKKVQVATVWRGERAGDAAVMSDPYDEQAAGIIESQDVRLSAKLATDITVQAGTIPTISGNLYTKVLVVTQSGPVTIPADSKGKVRLVLISGGQGGSGGANGEWGGSSGGGAATHGGAGGLGGDGGAGGRVLVVTLEVAPLAQLLANIGKGGKGGAGGGNVGELGSDTQFAGFSSNEGEHTKFGYLDPLYGTLYAAPGNSGVDGGAGGNGSGTYAQDSEKGADVGTNIGGSAGEASDIYKESLFANGGGGGGGAKNGSSANDGIKGTVNYLTGGECVTSGGNGGRGADAGNAEPTEGIASGGNGGNGGGGGGGAGGCRGGDYTSDSFGGTGGTGSDGGDGADGVLLIYY